MPPKSKYPSSAAGVGVPTLMPRTKTQKVSLTDPSEFSILIGNFGEGIEVAQFRSILVCPDLTVTLL